MTPENELKVEQIKRALIRAYEAYCSMDINQGKSAVEEAKIIQDSLKVTTTQVSRTAA